jgi:hypothetical protein
MNKNKTRAKARGKRRVKFVQIAVSFNGDDTSLFALAEDGSVWEHELDDDDNTGDEDNQTWAWRRLKGDDVRVDR